MCLQRKLRSAYKSQQSDRTFQYALCKRDVLRSLLLSVRISLDHFFFFCLIWLYSANVENLLLWICLKIQGISMKFYSFVLWVNFYQMTWTHIDPLKTWSPVGGAFPPDLPIVQTSKMFLSVCEQTISVKCYRMFFWWLSIRFLQLVLICGKKHGRQLVGHFCLIWL